MLKPRPYHVRHRSGPSLGLAVLATILVGAGSLWLLSGCTAGTPNIDGADPTQTVGIEGTPSLAPPTEAPTAAILPPTALEVSPGSLRGKYASIDEMPIAAETKDAIKELLKESDVFIITEHVIVSIDRRLFARTKSNKVTGEGTDPAAALDSIQLMSPEFSDNLDDAYLLVRKLSDTTPARDGVGGVIKRMTVDNTIPLILNYTAEPDETFSIINTVTSCDNIVFKGVQRVDLFSVDPGAIGNFQQRRGKPEQYQAASLASFCLATTANPYFPYDRIQALNENPFYSVPTGLVLPITKQIETFLVPFKDEAAPEWRGIFKVTGTPFVSP